MNTTNKMTLLFLSGIFLLFVGGLLAGLKVYGPAERGLAESAPVRMGETRPGQMSWEGYQRTKLALRSFDLANGLSKKDLEFMSQKGKSLGFFFLLACVGLCLGLKHLPPRR